MPFNGIKPTPILSGCPHFTWFFCFGFKSSQVNAQNKDLNNENSLTFEMALSFKQEAPIQLDYKSSGYLQSTNITHSIEMRVHLIKCLPAKE